MKVHVVNLSRSVSRREHISAELQRLGVDYEIFTAVDGSAGEHANFGNYSESECIKKWRRPLTAGEVGCFASHYSLWQRCTESGEGLVIMEDDANPSPILPEALEILPQFVRFGYVRLAAIEDRNYVDISRELEPGLRFVRYRGSPLGTQCYALFPEAAAKLIAGSAQWTLPVDNYIDAFWQHGVPSIGLRPLPVAVSSQFQSTIADGPLSPSAQMRHRVWRPKRFLARQWSEGRRHWANMEYALGMRSIT